MILKIQKTTVIDKRNINGKVLETHEVYRIYRSFLFGLFRMYLNICPGNSWEISYQVRVNYEPYDYATTFSTYQEAERLIEEIRNNPDKFIK